jgi:hypothetical protein
MGLLEKANAFTRARSLLHRSLELLSEEPAPAGAPASAAPDAEPAPPIQSALNVPRESEDLPVFDIPVFQVRVENPEPAPEAPAPAAAPSPAGRSAVAPPATAPAAIAAQLVEAAAALDATIDLPSRLFGLLKERLGIAKGALLLLDAARGVFAPWAACGYDQPTLRRMRVPAEEPALAGIVGGLAVEVKDPKPVGELRRFFSSRESGAIERLLLAPLAADGRLAGLVVVTDPAPGGAGYPDVLARAAAAAVPALVRLRDEILKPARTMPASPREAREELTRFLAAHPRGAQPFTVFPLSLERCRRRVTTANPWLDPFRLEEDLRTVVSVFAADQGRAVHLGRLRFLVAVRDLGTTDTDLFAHQLATLLGSLFHATVFEPADAEIGTARGFPSGTDATPEAAAELLATLAAS